MWTSILRQTLRVFRRDPALACAAVITLALGIGANTALFAVVEAVLLRPLPFEQADRLVVLRHRDLRSGLTKPDIAIADFIDLRARQRSLEALGGFGAFQGTYFSDHEPLHVEGVALTPEALRAVRVTPALGRLLEEADVREGAAPVVLVSAGFWRTQLASDPEVLSKSILIGATRRQVVGVLPAGFRFPSLLDTDVVMGVRLPDTAPAERRSGWIYGMGRLRPGATLSGLQQELATLSGQLESEHPDQNQGSRYEALSLREAVVGDTQRALLLLLGAVAFVLVIAWANVGNLLLARALGRRHELAICVALGASRSRLAGEVFLESAGLALAGGIAGVAAAWVTVPVLATMVPNAAIVPGLARVGVDGSVLAFALAAAAVSALIVTAVPCIGLWRGAARPISRQRQATMDPGARLAASTLVAGQIALALVLLTCAGLTIRSLSNLLAVDPGFTPAGVAAVEFALPDGRYENDEARRAFYARAFAEVAGVPKVETVGAAMVTPLTNNNWTAPFQRADRPLARNERPPEVGWQLASAGYFRALRIPLRAGRLFDARDTTGPEVVIISEATAARFFPGENPIGQHVVLGDARPEIVGIVGNIRRASLTDEPRADLYFPFERVLSPQTTLFIRAQGDPVAVLPAVRAALQRIEPHAVLYETRTLASIAEESAAVTRLATQLLAGFAAIALLLSGVGVYGVMAYRVRLRTRELGTRLALGASPLDIASLVVRQSSSIAAAGLACGAAAALACGRLLTSVLFEVQPWDPSTLAIAAGLLGVTTLAATWLPARRAARVDPVSVLGAD